MDADLQGDVVPVFEWMASADGIGLDDMHQRSANCANVWAQFGALLNNATALSDDSQHTERLFAYRYEGQINNFAVLDVVSGQSLRGTGARIVTDNEGTDIAAAVSVGSATLGHEYENSRRGFGCRTRDRRLGRPGEFQSTVRSLTPVYWGGSLILGKDPLLVPVPIQCCGSTGLARQRLMFSLTYNSRRSILLLSSIASQLECPRTLLCVLPLRNNEPIGIDSFRVVSNDAQATRDVPEFAPGPGGVTQIWMNDVRLQGSAVADMVLLVAEKQIDVVLRGERRRRNSCCSNAFCERCGSANSGSTAPKRRALVLSPML